MDKNNWKELRFVKDAKSYVEENPFVVPKFELPHYDYDCEFIHQCKYIDECCYTGAKVTFNSRCSKERINQMLDNNELKPVQQINIHKSENVQVNQQGNQSVSTLTQTLTIEQLPQELIDQFKVLIKQPADNNRKGWVTFLNSLAKVGGTVSTLASLYSLFASGG